MFQCFHCLHKSVIWDSDYNYEDFGYEGEGIVQICHCCNCGAEIEYRIPISEEEIEEVKNDEILKEITNFCEECPSHEECPEEECVLYRIEKIVKEETDG